MAPWGHGYSILPSVCQQTCGQEDRPVLCSNAYILNRVESCRWSTETIEVSDLQHYCDYLCARSLCAPDCTMLPF